ncbi:RNA polymerase factor sigma-54 [candidate division WOR-3 bacterium]|nr:RNA polymerase factor sigma-54 [candidate division WOR-3 bacterium]
MAEKGKNTYFSGIYPSLSAKLSLKTELKLTLHQKLFVELLPLTYLDLLNEVTVRAEENPLCEIEEEPQRESEEEDYELDDPEEEGNIQATEFSIENFEKNSDIDLEEVFNDSVKTQWDRDKEDFSPFSFLSSPNDGKENLKIQFHVQCQDKSLYYAGEFIIDSIGKDGYMTLNLADLSMISSESLENLKHALEIVKGLDPPGIGSYDLEESLKIQLERAGEKESLAYRIVSQGGLDYLKNKDYKALARLFKVSASDIAKANMRIKALDPRPGASIFQNSPQYIIPDFTISAEGEDLVISAIWRKEEIPFVKLKISRSQYNEIVQNMRAEIEKGQRDRKDLVDFERQYNEALFLSRLPRYIRDRENSIEKVVRAIVSRQLDYLKRTGPLKPLTEKEIAEETKLHPSTVSRIIQNKYIETENGLISLKSFFSTTVKSQFSSPKSSAQVQEIIKKIVGEENTLTPLTDDEISNVLKQKGFDVARRTVAKYRAVLGILPSNMRKKIDFPED